MSPWGLGLPLMFGAGARVPLKTPLAPNGQAIWLVHDSWPRRGCARTWVRARRHSPIRHATNCNQMLSSSSCARPAGAFRESRTPPGGRASNGGWRALGRAAVDRLRASASASGGAPDNIREQAKRLSKLFYAAEDDPFLAGRSPGSGEAGPVPAKVLKNLPLWCVARLFTP